MAVAQGANPISLTPTEQEKVTTPLQDAWKQFRRNKLAVVSLVFIIGLVVLAFTAGLWKSVGLVEDFTTLHQGGGAQGMAYAEPFTCSTDQPKGQPQYCFVFGRTGKRTCFMTKYFTLQ